MESGQNLGTWFILMDFYRRLGINPSRDGNWKLVAHKDLWELYNLESDPVEEMNLIKKEKKKLTELKALYENWASQFEITKR